MELLILQNIVFQGTNYRDIQYSWSVVKLPDGC